MTITEALERIAQEAATARENAKANGETTLSGAFDGGRYQGLREAGEIVSRLQEVKQ